MSDSTGSALDGLRVIDLSRVLAGPYCTQILADHGADVLKIESPDGDETRGWGPPFDDQGMAAYFAGLNRNKRILALDLKQESDRQRLAGLLEGADVLIENFKPGTLAGWDFADEQLRQRYPRLVHARISGYGDDGPLGGLPGYDATVQACAGLMSVNGEIGAPALRLGVPAVDLATGLNAAIGILLALHERARSGEGQKVETTLFDCALSVLHPYSANFLCSGATPTSEGNAHPNITPYDSFSTADGSLFLAVGNNRQFASLCEALDRPALARDPRFADNASRGSHRDELKAELVAAMASRDTQALLVLLQQAGVPAAPILDVPAALGHPQARHRESVWRRGAYAGVAPPVRLERTPARFRAPPANRDRRDGNDD